MQAFKKSLQSRFDDLARYSRILHQSIGIIIMINGDTKGTALLKLHKWAILHIYMLFYNAYLFYIATIIGS